MMRPMNYAAPTPPPGQAPAPPTPVFELSGWWARAGAFIIDAIIVGVLTMVIGGILGVALFGVDENSEGGAFDATVIVVSLLVGTIYYCAIMTSTNGQTVGKQATGIRVVREDGLPVDVTFAFVRQTIVIGLLFNLFGALLVVPWLANYLWPLWDDNNQALHDKMVKSRVVRAHPVMFQQYGPPAGYAPPAQPYAPPQQPYAAPPQPYAPPPPAPPAPPPPAALPPPPQPPAQSQPQPYTPPPGFENPVPEDD